MNISKLSQNCSFKALVIHPYKEDYTRNFLKKYEDVVLKASKDMDLYVSYDDKVVQQGADYAISNPVINVAVHPVEITDENGTMRLNKNYKTVLSTAFSYVPSIINEKEGKFAEVLQKSISLIGWYLHVIII